MHVSETILLQKNSLFYWANQTFSAKTVDLLLLSSYFKISWVSVVCTAWTARARSSRDLRRLKLELGEVWVPIWTVKKSNPAKVLLSSSRHVKTEWRAVETASLGSQGEPVRVRGWKGYYVWCGEETSFSKYFIQKRWGVQTTERWSFWSSGLLGSDSNYLLMPCPWFTPQVRNILSVFEQYHRVNTQGHRLHHTLGSLGSRQQPNSSLRKLPFNF